MQYFETAKLAGAIEEKRAVFPKRDGPKVLLIDSQATFDSQKPLLPQWSGQRSTQPNENS